LAQGFLNGSAAWIAREAQMNTVTAAIRQSRLSGRVTETGRALAVGLRSHAWLYAVATTAQLVAIVASFHLGRPFEVMMVVLFSLPIIVITAAAALYLVIKELIRLWRINHQGSATVALGRLVADDFLAPERLANIVHSTVVISIFMSAFTTLKIFLPEIHAFQWDVAFMEWDRTLHFGFHPYELLQPVLGYPHISKALNIAYNAWFFVMFTAWIVLGYARYDTRLRQHFLLAFMLCWFTGTNVLGTIFSSAGPCFYGRLLGVEDPFQPLMVYLNQVNAITELYSLATQHMLWEGYVGNESVLKGISAMPSMHVATCVLLALLGFASGRRWLGWSFVVFTAVIFLASIHLAWHYAIDGYAGAVVALVAWFGAGRIVRWDQVKQSLANA
jgi:hypothetical protein